MARYEYYRRDLAYRIYVTDCLKSFCGVNIRYAELFTPKETRTAEEIVGGVREKLRQLGGD